MWDLCIGFNHDDNIGQNQDVSTVIPFSSYPGPNYFCHFMWYAVREQKFENIDTLRIHFLGMHTNSSIVTPFSVK